VLTDGQYIVGTCCYRSMLGPLAYEAMANPTGAVAGNRVPMNTPIDCPRCMASMRDPAVNT
jgi:hypothetical protein